MKKPIRKRFTIENRLDALTGQAIRMSMFIEKNRDAIISAMERAVASFNNDSDCNILGLELDKSVLWSSDIKLSSYVTENILKRTVIIDATSEHGKNIVVGNLIHEDISGASAVTPIPFITTNKDLCPFTVLIESVNPKNIEIILNHELIHNVFYIYILYRISSKLERLNIRTLEQANTYVNMSEVLAYALESYTIDFIFSKNGRRKRVRSIRKIRTSTSTHIQKAILGIEIK